MEKRARVSGARIAKRVDRGRDWRRQSIPPLPRTTSRRLECDRGTLGVRAYGSSPGLTRVRALQPRRFLRRPRLYRARRAAGETPGQVQATIRSRTALSAQSDHLLARW